MIRRDGGGRERGDSLTGEEERGREDGSDVSSIVCRWRRQGDNDSGRRRGPFVLNRKETHPPRKGCRGAQRRTRGKERAVCFGSCLASACSPSVPPSRHAYVLRIHTLTCHHRVETELIEVNLPFLLLLPLPPPTPELLRSRLKVKRAVVIRRGTWRLPLKTCLSKVSSLARIQPVRPLLRGRFVCLHWISRAIRHGNSCRAVL